MNITRIGKALREIRDNPYQPISKHGRTNAKLVKMGLAKSIPVNPFVGTYKLYEPTVKLTDRGLEFLELFLKLERLSFYSQLFR